MATVPNFGALAQQQQAADDDATRRTTWSQRPDQSGPMGSTTWNQDASGRWINNTSLSGGAQGLFDATMQGQQGLAGTIGAGLDYGSLPAMPDSGFGASQQVIDAWTALNEPGLQKSEAAARQRAAAMGLTMGSNAWGDQERSLGNTRTDAANKAILAGTTEYGNVFNRGMQARQQAQSEADKKYGAAISGAGALTGVRDSLNPNKWLSDVPTGAAYKPQTIYGAAQDQYNAQRMEENADIARSEGNTQAAIEALRAAGGISGVGSMIGAAAPYVGKAWDWASGYFGGGGSDYDWTGSAEYF